MNTYSAQAPHTVVMVRPHYFTVNPETATDNSFQQSSNACDSQLIAKKAYQEVTNAVNVLQQHGVDVHLFEDESQQTPDSVFPNNWFSTHENGTVVIYPMYTPNRRKERRSDIIEFLKARYQVKQVVDLSHYENQLLILEGTGAMVLDHIQRIAYTARSKRASDEVLDLFCRCLNYQPMLFDALDQKQLPIYHTNVMMCIATKFALIGLDMIIDTSTRKRIEQQMISTGRKIIALDHQQVGNFCGNALELKGKNGNLLALSQTAFNALSKQQRQIILQSAELVPIDIPTIELAGGSLRCMLAAIHLTPRELFCLILLVYRKNNKELTP